METHVVSGNTLSQSLLRGDRSSMRNSVNRFSNGGFAGRDEADDIHTEVRTRLREEDIYNFIYNFIIIFRRFSYMQAKF